MEYSDYVSQETAERFPGAYASHRRVLTGQKTQYGSASQLLALNAESRCHLLLLLQRFHWLKYLARVLGSTWIIFEISLSGTARARSLGSDLREISYVYLFGRTMMMDRGEENGTPLQYSCLENPKDRWAWWAAVHGVAKSRTWLSDTHVTMELLEHQWIFSDSCY